MTENQDNSFGSIHYEGNLLPGVCAGDVVLMNINLEARHPDVIFIHNPYDDAIM